MNIFAKIIAKFASFLKYAPYALAGAQAVEAAVGAGNGADKKQLVIAGILAGAHAGETVPVPQVQAIAGVVDIVVGTLNAAGLLGKTPTPVSVPPELPPS
jgi:hypothetical protein